MSNYAITKFSYNGGTGDSPEGNLVLVKELGEFDQLSAVLLGRVKKKNLEKEVAKCSQHRKQRLHSRKKD